jgi:hypothetical protein
MQLSIHNLRSCGTGRCAVELNPIYMVIAAIFVGWFAIGMIYNLRRGDAYMRWMQEGMPRVGERTTMRWLGSSVAEMIINKAKKPFRRLEILLVFPPRDVSFLWLWAALRGRRDTLILRGQLQSPVRVDLELADPGYWTGRTVISELSKRGWERRPYQGQVLLAPQGLLDLAQSELERLSPAMSALSRRYGRFGLRRQNSQFEFHLPLPERGRASGEFFEALRAVGKTSLGDEE